ncbi:MAG TPA: hypothetical protein VGX96_13425 [Candidatus Elarobacter sp.]|jgi:hypothetical protein|nr:hypothetical protein [Candidatus Elarobacter sp.]
MSPRLRQGIAVTVGVLLLVSVFVDAFDAVTSRAHIGFVAVPGAQGSAVVRSINDRSGINGPLAVGDRIRLADHSLMNQFRFIRSQLGDRFDFTGTTPSGTPTRFTATMTRAGPPSPTFWVYELLQLAAVLVGLVVAIRRPNDEVARILVALLLGLAALLGWNASFYPIWLVGAAFVVARFCQIYVAWAALQLAVTFPKRSERGVRRWLERANLPYAIVCLVTVFSALYFAMVRYESPSPVLQGLGIAETVLYFVFITLAFVIGGRGATGADAKRAQWVAWTLAAGFSGTLAAVVMLMLHVPLGPVYEWTGLTLIAVPFGLGYAIVRHRVVDIGFVVNRALVFGGVSAIVVIAFGILEWLLSNIFVRVSHITSTSLELALALALGFSLRSIHKRVDRVVDDLFFRDRHEAERALRTAARELAFVTDPRVAVERAHGELLAHTGASAVSIYVVDGTRALRVDPAESAAPDAAGIDDPALVRLRASRTPSDLHALSTSFAGEWAFPMCVRDAVTGAVVLGPKSNGEAFAPDELGTIETVALALGNALDALQTAALKAEVARVLLDGVPVETLRRTVDAASWARGVAPQPAGSLPGLRE